MAEAFIITNEQLQAFRDPLRKSFYADTAKHLRQKFPLKTQAMSDDALKAVMAEGIQKAANYNIIERTDTRRFLEYIIALGMEFDTKAEYERVSDILTIANLPGAEKIRRMIAAYPLIKEN